LEALDPEEFAGNDSDLITTKILAPVKMMTDVWVSEREPCVNPQVKVTVQKQSHLTQMPGSGFQPTN
jgi:hypothetical protein